MKGDIVLSFNPHQIFTKMVGSFFLAINNLLV